MKNMILALSMLVAITAFAAGSAWEPGDTKCVPNFRNEKAVGYICVKVEERSEYAVIGLRKGDNVFAINGQAVFDSNVKKDPIERALNLWRDFDRQESGTLSVERGDLKIELKKQPRKK